MEDESVTVLQCNHGEHIYILSVTIDVDMYVCIIKTKE